MAYGRSTPYKEVLKISLYDVGSIGMQLVSFFEGA